MHKEKHWWQQEVNCCPACGSVDIRYRTGEKKWVCNRLYCKSTFENPIMSSKDNREHISSLRGIYRSKFPF